MKLTDEEILELRETYEEKHRFDYALAIWWLMALVLLTLAALQRAFGQR